MWSPGHERTVALLLGPVRAMVICGDLTPIALAWDEHRTTVAASNGHDDWAVAPLRADVREYNGLVVLLTSRYAAAAAPILEATTPRDLLGEMHALRSDPYIRLPIAPRTKTDTGLTYVAERATMNALISVLADRPELRQRLADQRRTAQLAADISKGMLRPPDTAIVHRRRTREILAAMDAAGLAHPYHRPLPGDPVPSIDTALSAVRDTLVHATDHGDDHDERHGDDDRPDDEHIGDVVRKYYVDLAPWPFWALLAP